MHFVCFFIWDRFWVHGLVSSWVSSWVSSRPGSRTGFRTGSRPGSRTGSRPGSRLGLISSGFSSHPRSQGPRPGGCTPISDLYGYVRPQTPTIYPDPFPTPHYLPWPVRWTPIFLSLSVRSPHTIYRDSFVHRELWNYLSLVGNWLFRTLVFGLKMSQIAPQSI